MIGLTMLRGDLFRMARRRTTHVVRFAFVAVLLAATALAWPWDGLRLSPDAGSHMMAAFVVCELLAAGLFIPAFVAPAIAGEREQGTLDILAGCPQTDLDLVLGRGLSLGTAALLLLMAGAPFAVGAMIVGGAPVKLAAIALTHAVLMGTFSIAVALLASLTSATANQATSAAYSGVLGTMGAGAVLTYVGLGFTTGNFAGGWLPGTFLLGVVACGIGYFARLRAAGAVGAVLLGLAGLIGYAVVESGFRGRGPSPLTIDRTLAVLCPWGSSLSDMVGQPLDHTSRFMAWGSQIILTTVIVLVIAGRLRKSGLELRVEGSDPAPVKVAAPRAVPVVARPRPVQTQVHFFDSAASPSSLLHGDMPPPRPVAPRPALPRSAESADGGRKRRSAVPVWDNPVLWKDIKILKNPVSGCMIGMGVAACGLLTIPVLAGGPSGSRGSLAALTLIIDLLFLALVLAPTCGSVLAKERTTGNLAILAATGYPVQNVVAGKLAAVAWHLRAPLVLTLLRVGLVSIQVPQVGLAAGLIIATSLVSLACVSVAAAAIVPNAKASVVAAFMAGVTLWGGPAILEAFGFVRDVPNWLTPWGMLWETLSPEFLRHAEKGPPFAPWLMFQGLLAVASFLVATAFVGRSSRE